jgi:hypothetical protein
LRAYQNTVVDHCEGNMFLVGFVHPSGDGYDIGALPGPVSSRTRFNLRGEALCPTQVPTA